MKITIKSKKATKKELSDHQKALQKVLAKYPQGVGVNWPPNHPAVIK